MAELKTKENAGSVKDFLAAVEPERLPCLYGGACSCQAQCVYSDKGPWTDVLNVIDFQNRQYTTTEAEFHENTAAREEFKMIENENSDDEDLLGGMNDIERLKQAFTKRKCIRHIHPILANFR